VIQCCVAGKLVPQNSEFRRCYVASIRKVTDISEQYIGPRLNRQESRTIPQTSKEKKAFENSETIKPATHLRD